MTDSHDKAPFVIPPADTSSIRRKQFDIPYAAQSPAQKLDIYWPEAGDGPFPVIVSIHGGAFLGGDKSDGQLAPMLPALEHGYAVVSINYRMSGEAIFPALLHDAKAAVRWVRANAAAYRFDPARIAAWGGSAGGWQAAMLGVSDGVAELEDCSQGNPEQSSTIQVVVDWFGPTDFLKMDVEIAASGFYKDPEQAHDSPRSPESLLMGAPIQTIPERVQSANPESYIRPGLPPFLIQHGTADDIVPHQQSVHFAEKLRAALGSERVTLDLLEGARHGDPRFGSPENVSKVLAFLDRVLKHS